MAAVRQRGDSLQYASEDMQDNEKVVLAALQKAGHSLQYSSKGMRNNEEVVLAAMQQNDNGFQYASKDMNNEMVVLAAVQKMAIAFSTLQRSSARADTQTTHKTCLPPGPNACRDEITPLRGTPHFDSEDETERGLDTCRC